MDFYVPLPPYWLQEKFSKRGVSTLAFNLAHDHESGSLVVAPLVHDCWFLAAGASLPGGGSSCA